MTEKFSESRYPYTYAWDLVRSWATEDSQPNEWAVVTSIISRAGTSRMCGKIADAIGVDKVAMAEALADVYMKQNGIVKP